MALIRSGVIEFDLSIIPLAGLAYETLNQLLIISCLQAGNRATFLLLLGVFINNFAGFELFSIKLRHDLG
jgi:hypothetical protein